MCGRHRLFVSHGSKPAVATESLPDGFVLVSPTVSGVAPPPFCSDGNNFLFIMSHVIYLFWFARGDEHVALSSGRKIRATRSRCLKPASSSRLKISIRQLAYCVDYFFIFAHQIEPGWWNTGAWEDKEENGHVRAIDLNRQALIVKRKKAARYFRFSSCFEFITSSNLSHVGPCCVLGHFQLSKYNDAFSAVLSRPSI